MVGVDYGTLSGRAVVVRVSDGTELGSAVLPYPHGVMDRVLAATGDRLPPDWALQVPSDYVDVLRQAVPEALAAAGVRAEDVIGIGTDFTACTVLPVLADGTPLSELPEFTGRPHAYVKLWKHHAAQPHADRITALAEERGERWLPRYGGRISSEWEFAKGLQLLEEDPEIYARMDHWIEAADWIVWQLCGAYVRDACTTGYKAIYQEGEYPSREYLAALNPGFAGFAEEKVAPPHRLAGCPGGFAHRRGRRLDRVARGHRRLRGQRRRPRDRPRRPGRRAGADGRDHGHVDLPRDELRPARRGPGHVRRRGRRDRARLVGLRGGADRRRRHLRLVRRHLRPARLCGGGRRAGAWACTNT